MVFKPFSHLARQSFTKSLAHGYAQSFVAASQSSYASQNTQFGHYSNHHASRFGKPGTLQLCDFSYNVSTPTPASTTAKLIFSVDGGLDAYYSAWQRHQRGTEDKEWKQFQFTRRIGWIAPSGTFDGKGIEGEDVGIQSDSLSVPVKEKDHTRSTSAVENIKTSQANTSEGTEFSHVNVTTTQKVTEVQHSTGTSDNQLIVKLGLERELNQEQLSSPICLSSTPFSLLQKSIAFKSSSISDETANTSQQSTQYTLYEDEIGNLDDAKQYAQIPRVFESMLKTGLLPSVRAYNALLSAAIHLPTTKHHVVPKALDIYSDMLRRKVLPSTTTYTILLELLAHRALEVTQMKAARHQVRLRFGGMDKIKRFLFRSFEAECEILAEDDALSIAIKLFDLSTAASMERSYCAKTYRLLLNACAKYGDVENMIRIYSHMESQRVVPDAAIYGPMINAFAASGDLRSAVECYNEYKSLAIADDKGKLAITQRTDDQVYAAVVKAYIVCGKQAGADRFFNKIVDSFTNASTKESHFPFVRDTIMLDAVIQERLESGEFKDALRIARRQEMTPKTFNEAITRICIAAADEDNYAVATNAYHDISSFAINRSAANVAMLAMYIRQDDVDSAQNIWSAISSESKPTNDLIEPTSMYAATLIRSGKIDEGLGQLRQFFGRIRDCTTAQAEIMELIDESFEFIGSVLVENNIVPSAQATLNFMWAMIENGGLVPTVTEQLLAGLGSDEISTLDWQDLRLALQVEAGFVNSKMRSLDIAHCTRFANMLELSLANHMPLDQRTLDLVEICAAKLRFQWPALIERWYQHKRSRVIPDAQSLPSTAPVGWSHRMLPTVDENYDPHATTVDHRGSLLIVEELERQGVKTSASLNEALLRFRNIRRAGRHPRYIAYAKLISTATRAGRANLVYDILGMARQDIPLLPHYPVVRHGWTSILDAMVGASLAQGDRRAAADFHQELLNIGAAPTANTFGLYITTLKESTKTFDEATEAVKVFHRAKLEGVKPSSFLYNALIGKLGKARRIDDCLFYFADMRSHGIRPTSVTYGTVVNALCRVSDERFAQELFDEMESMPNYKPRPAPYNSLMQFFLSTKRDREKVLEYYQRMQSKKIQPTMHTFKLLIDAYATLEPINMTAAEGVFDIIRASGQVPEAVHYASLIHAKGCSLHDMAAARRVFDDGLASGAVSPQACLYQALFESMVANHCVRETRELLKDMATKGVERTPYIANTLIHGWAMEHNVIESKAVYDSICKEKREPSTYEAMARAFLAAEDRDGASEVVREMISRGYPSAVSNKILELLGHGASRFDDSLVPTSSSEQPT